MHKRRILIVSSEYPPGPGGIGHHAYSLTKGLLGAGHDVEVMTVSDFATEEMKRAFDEEQPFPVTRYPRLGWRTYARRISMTLEKVGNGGFDWVFLTGKFPLWTGLAIKRRFPRQKTLAILHGSEVRPSNRIVRSLTTKSIGACDRVVSVSHFTASLLPRRVREDKRPTIIPNGIDLAELSEYGKGSGSRLTGQPSLLTVGHVSPRKGQHRVILALPRLAKTFPGIHYHMVGRPIDRDRLERLAQSLGVSDKVSFHGVAKAHSDLADYYNNADVFMLLSENQPDGDVEGFGIVALEANYFGLPVVGARFCGVEDAVDEGRSGRLVDGNDPESIALAVQDCMDRQESLRNTSRTWAEKHDWSRIVPQFESMMS
jgi:phosphatidylinositol alpha-1,6-mannosyltransferase